MGAEATARKLDFMRADIEEPGSSPAARLIAGHAALLLKAVEAALEPHQPGRVTILGALCKRHENHRHFSITSTEADDVRACPDCAATVYSSCAGCGPQVSVDACPTRLAITAALAGKEAGDSSRYDIPEERQ